MPTKNKNLARKYRREYYYRNLDQEKLRVKQRKTCLQNIIEQVKDDSQCACGEGDNRCLVFHHVGLKLENIANIPTKGWSIDRLMREMEKCLILCANCHRKLRASVA